MYNNVHFIPSLLAILLSTPLLTRAPLLVFVYPSTRLPLRLRPSSVVCSLLRSLHAATNSIMNLTLALPTSPAQPSPAKPSPAQPPHPRTRAPGSHFRILVVYWVVGGYFISAVKYLTPSDRAECGGGSLNI